jgi:Rrf2 family transcriptional regulator, iron-sulfur cluster assembly transcription factor
VRLEITRRSDLASRAVVVLARSGSRMKSAELADALGTTAGFMPQVLGPLVERGWVISVPGPTGGYEAVAAPERLSVLDVIEAVEGPTVTGRCVLVDRLCSDAGHCALHQPWGRARAGLLDELARTSLAELEVP